MTSPALDRGCHPPHPNSLAEWPKAFKGSVTKGCQDAGCTMGSKGGTKDMKTASNKLLKVKTDLSRLLKKVVTLPTLCNPSFVKLGEMSLLTSYKHKSAQQLLHLNFCFFCLAVPVGPTRKCVATCEHKWRKQLGSIRWAKPELNLKIGGPTASERWLDVNRNFTTLVREIKYWGWIWTCRVPKSEDDK